MTIDEAGHLLISSNHALEHQLYLANRDIVFAVQGNEDAIAGTTRSNRKLTRKAGLLP